MRLGVETLGDRVRLKENCKQFADGERRTNVASTSSVGSSQAQQLIEERRRLFQPYSSRREKGSGTSKSAKRKNPSRRTWTGQFVCLADRQACRVPSSSEKQILQQAGLGLKKINFFVDENEEEVVEKLTSDMPGDDGHPIGFPQLKEGKGFEIMSCVTNSRDLAVIKSSPMLTFPSSSGNGNQAEAGPSSSQGISTISETHFIGNQTESSDSSPMLTFPSSSGNGNQAEAGPSSSQGISAISETHFIGNQTESSDSSPMLTFPSSSGNGNQAEAGPSSSQGISTISETHFIGSQTESTAHPLEGTSLGPLTNNDHITMEKFDVDIALIMPKIKEHIYSTDILNNPVEILRYVQSQLVRGRTLDVAEDFGGPRKEFFSLCVKAIKEKYFDDGLLNHQAEAYYLVGVILGLSILQNGVLPRFIGEENLQEIFFSPNPNQCAEQLRNGFSKLGIVQIANEFPIFLHLLRPNPTSVLTLKKVTHLLQLEFSVEGSNRRQFEDAVYRQFVKYLHRAAAGQRGNVTLSHILQFATGAEEEPVLGFSIHPSIAFVDAENGFVPTANTCINSLMLVRPTISKPLPYEYALFKVFDYAFLNSYFGNM
ncbi:unnamed protein product [Porites lobata]|uniref:HECT domain-containing protein n=1 Tax=Porites lobata TaxID=104759 RepID=A0ABN8R711_9CNID|nr:unnamed protein product [Porites lobata]